MIERLLAILVLSVWLAGCATTPTTPQPPGPALAQVRADPQAYLGQSVHWGGEIARVDNRAESTDIEIVQQPLDDDGRPRESPTSAGRFIARFEVFLDPVIYAPGKRLTVTGTLQDTVAGRIGEHAYRYPVVAVDEHRLWPRQEPPRVIYYHDPWWYGDPFFNAVPFPYYRRPYRR